jgi:diacylglycerol kinase family enzyme
MNEVASSQVVQLFSNPGAGRRRGRTIDALAAAFEAQGARVVRSLSAGGPPIIADEATHVCIAGGDGTVRHVANAVLSSGRAVRMSIYPTGTINLLAMEAGYPRDPQAFARRVLAEDEPRQHYPVAMDGGHFFACAGVGPDSIAVAAVSPRLKRAVGRFAYAFAAVRLLASWRRHRIVLTADGRETGCEAFYVAKSRYYAGRWSLAKEARVDRPVLHVVALRRARRRDYLRFVAAVVRHRDPAELDNVAAFTCSALRADAAEPLPLQADGDIVGTMPVTMAIGETPLAFCRGASIADRDATFP